MIYMDELIKTFKKNDGTVAVDGRNLHEFLGIKERYNDWFSRMLDYGFTETIDFISFTEKKVKPQGGRPKLDHALTLDMAKELSMIQRTEKGKQARQYFIRIEKDYQNEQVDMSQLSPELQALNGLINQMNEQALSQKRIQGQLNKQDQKLDGLSEIIGTSTLDWRNETAHLINAMAVSEGNSPEVHRSIRNAIYDETDRRGGVSLKTRLTNLRRRMADEGVSVSKRNRMSKVDVISQDKKLVEIFVAIVKEYAIRYGIWNEEY